MQLPPASLLNKIAKAVPLKHPAMKALFQMNQAQQDQQQAAQRAALLKAGNDPIVVTAYQALMPLLLENVAISKYIEQTGNTELRMTLPELVNKSELVAVADRDLMLSDQQKQALSTLLH